jgi:hypothetical protein
MGDAIRTTKKTSVTQLVMVAGHACHAPITYSYKNDLLLAALEHWCALSRIETLLPISVPHISRFPVIEPRWRNVHCIVQVRCGSVLCGGAMGYDVRGQNVGMCMSYVLEWCVCHLVSFSIINRRKLKYALCDELTMHISMYSMRWLIRFLS